MSNALIEFVKHPLLAIDVGTSKVAVQTCRSKAVKSAPFFTAIDKRRQGREEAQQYLGDAAKRMFGRSPDGIEIVRPMAEGVIGDLGAAKTFFRDFLRKNVPHSRWDRSVAVVAIPFGLRTFDRHVLEECLGAVGVTRRKTVACHIAALAYGVPDYRCRLGILSVDVGAGKTEIAVVSLGRTIAARNLRCGGDMMTAAICTHFLRHHGFEIGTSEAEMAKISWGTVRKEQTDDQACVLLRGKCRHRGVPLMREFPRSELAKALSVPLELIADAVMSVLEEVPPEVLASVFDQPVCLTGGAAQLDGFDLALAGRIGAEVELAIEPEFAVVRGLAQLDCGYRTQARQQRLTLFSRGGGRTTVPRASWFRSLA